MSKMQLFNTWRMEERNTSSYSESCVFAVSRIWGLALQHPRGYLPPPGFSAATSSILIVLAQVTSSGPGPILEQMPMLSIDTQINSLRGRRSEKQSAT